MNEKASSLSGFWTGVYDYPGNLDEAVPFNAMLIDIAGLITGEIDEPNTFSRDMVGRLFAKVSGNRAGSEISFVKTYEKVKDAGHDVHYVGTANDDFTKIEGQWTVTDHFGSWSGPFIMNRASGKNETTATDIREEILIKK